MEGKEELKFKAVDAEGRQIDCDTLFMFESPETQKNYIVYTDNSIDEEGNIRVYASIYNPEDLKMNDDEDMAALKIIETILEEMQNQVEEANQQ